MQHFTLFLAVCFFLFAQVVHCRVDWTQVKDTDIEREGIDESEKIDPRSFPKAEMAFVTLKDGYKAADISQQWMELMKTDGLESKSYAFEADKVLFVADHGISQMMKIKEFVLKRHETIEFEWNQSKFKPQRDEL